MTRPAEYLAAALLALAALLPAAQAAMRADTYDEARKAAGADGVMVYLYGPDWNTRSTKMLKSFWESKQVEEAAGDAALVAVPIYQDTAKSKDDPKANARGSLSIPGFTFCPRVLMLDADGHLYADLIGTDDLGGLDGAAGVENIRTKLGFLRKRNELMEQANAASGIKKAEILREVSDLPIKHPSSLLDAIKEADPTDKTGAVRRNSFKSREDFLYKMMETKDGFLTPGFEPDMGLVKREATKIFQDKAYRNADRQAAYNLLIGLSRQDAVSPTVLKNLIRANQRLDGTTRSGMLCPTILTRWGDAKPDKEAAKKRRASKEKRKQYEKNKREEKKREDRANRNIKVN